MHKCVAFEIRVWLKYLYFQLAGLLMVSRVLEWLCVLSEQLSWLRIYDHCFRWYSLTSWAESAEERGRTSNSGYVL